MVISGDVWLLNLDPTIGSETVIPGPASSSRPEMQDHLRTVIAAPMATGHAPHEGAKASARLLRFQALCDLGYDSYAIGRRSVGRVAGPATRVLIRQQFSVALIEAINSISRC